MEKKKYNFPEVKLGQYKGLAITRHVRPVTEKTLDIEMVHQTRMHPGARQARLPRPAGFCGLHGRQGDSRQPDGKSDGGAG